jgi:hypothetical protein
MMSRWFRLGAPVASGKTNIWMVIALEPVVTLGEIRWYGAWRQYTFFPFSDTLWNSECLEDLAEVLKDLNSDHRKNAATNRNERLAMAFTEDMPVLVPRAKHSMEE